MNFALDCGHCEESVSRQKIRRTKLSALVNEVSACNKMESVCYTTVRKKVWVFVNGRGGRWVLSNELFKL